MSSFAETMAGSQKRRLRKHLCRNNFTIFEVEMYASIMQKSYKTSMINQQHVLI